jgi:signal transduction histidine kinase
MSDKPATAPVKLLSTRPAPVVRVLHLEDNRVDAEIVRRLLATECPDSQLTLVSSRFAFLGELQLRPFDLIISDFTLESFNGIEALELARLRAPQVPFVFYSGSIGEERAAQALQSGAQDYVPKGQVKRLESAIRQALAVSAERRQRQQAERLSRELQGALDEARAAGQKLSREQARLQRLENIMVLAGGASHDLNNMLTPMLMAVSLLRESAPGTGNRHLLETLEKSARRSAELVSQILVITQAGAHPAHLVEPDGLVRQIAQRMTETFPGNLRIEVALPPDLWQIEAIPQQLHQMLLNLCVNAREAMPGGGTLSVGAQNCRLDDVAARGLPGARAGTYVVLHVEDTGGGIAPDLLPRIWDPANKGKSAGGQIPLGLPTVNNIVKRHGGFIQLKSVVGLGTSFRIYLPAWVAMNAETGAASAQPA